MNPEKKSPNFSDMLKQCLLTRLNNGVPDATEEEWVDLEVTLLGPGRFIVTDGLHELWDLLTSWGSAADVRFNLRCAQWEVLGCLFESRTGAGIVFEYEKKPND